MNINIQFLQQQNSYPDGYELQNACGAFCIKYWHWHSGREDSQTVNQEKTILDTYNHIKFGDNGIKYDIPPDWGNPFEICRQCGGAFFFDIRDSFIAPLSKTIREKITDIPIVESELTLEIGQYAILLLRSKQSPQHYVLAYRKSAHEYYCHDPSAPHPILLKNGFPKLGDYVSCYELKYMGAGILLPSKSVKIHG